MSLFPYIQLALKRSSQALLKVDSISSGITILGTYTSADELNTAHPNGSAGDAYLINSELYVWSITTNAWENVGNIKGPKGDTGEKGDKGEPGNDGVSVTHSWNGTTLTVSSVSGTSSSDLKGDKGDKGDTGEKGDKGDTGEKGEKGDTGDAGTDGVDGVSCAHSWNGTELIITSASGTSSADLKGPKGDTGETGSAGVDGKSAYAYAQDAGYTGTEEEFAESLYNIGEGVSGNANRPKLAMVNLPASGWIDAGTGVVFYQEIALDGVGGNVKVDLQPTPEQLAELMSTEISMTTSTDAENPGVVIFYAIGDAPEIDYAMQVIITEVDVI